MTKDEFKKIRIEAGFTTQELADVLMFSRYSTIWDYESGNRGISSQIAMLMRLLQRKGFAEVVALHE